MVLKKENVDYGFIVSYTPWFSVVAVIFLCET